MDCRTHERGVGMLNTPYVKKDTIKNFFPVPNAVFDLGLHHMEISIYAYLLRIEDRRTYQCIVSYVGAFRAEMPRRGKVPTLRWGKHSVRLYAGRTRRGKAPAPPSPQGGERSLMQRKKSAIITARMTPGIKDLIQHQAKQAGMTVTDYIITCALGKEIVRVDGLDEILAEVKAQGRNLNQLTTLANMGRIQILRSDELIDGYADLCQKLLRISREVQ